MTTLGVYLGFSGNCREAVNYYKEVLAMEVISMQTFAEMPDGDMKEKCTPEQLDRIMHAELKTEGFTLMCSDGMKPEGFTFGDAVSISLGYTELEKMEIQFNAMAEEGTVLMPLHDTFWQAKFGMIKDKYGHQWMFNCSTK